MKKVINLLFIVFFTCNGVYAQESKAIDGLIRKIKNEQNDSLKKEYTFDLCVIYQRKNIAKYKYYLQLLKTKQKNNSYNGLGLYSLLNATNFLSIGDYKHSVEYSNKASILFKKNKNKEKYLDAIYYNVVANYYLGNVSFAEKEAEHALVEAKKYRFYSQIASLQYFIGCSYARKNQLDKALKAQNNAIEKYKKIKNDLGVINCYNEIVTLYIYEENWDKAIEYSDLILELGSKLKKLEDQTKSLLYTTVASAYNGAKQNDKALKYALEANKINLKIGNPEIIVNNLNVLVAIYSALGQIDLAIKYGKLITQCPATEEYKIEAYNLLSKNYQTKKNYKKALYYQTKSVEVIDRLDKSDGNSSKIYRVAYKDLAEIQNYLGDYTHAYSNLTKYIVLNNEVVENDKKNDINGLLLKFDSKEKNLKLKELELQKKNKELAYNIQHNYLIFMSSLFLLTTSLLIILFILYKRNSNKNKLIISQNIELELFSNKLNKSLQEKELLLKEIHHRVKNNLQIIMSMLSIQAKEGKSVNIKEFLEKSETRIYSMLLIHKILYENESLGEIDFGKYVENLTTTIFNLIDADANVEHEIVIENVFFDITTAIPLGLILNELLSNSFKYAFPENYKKNKIRIDVFKIDNKTYLLKYSDNGVGFQNDDIEKRSLGLDLVFMLAKQLNGNFIKNEVESLGSHFSIQFEEIL